MKFTAIPRKELGTIYDCYHCKNTSLNQPTMVFFLCIHCYKCSCTPCDKDDKILCCEDDKFSVTDHFGEYR